MAGAKSLLALLSFKKKSKKTPQNNQFLCLSAVLFPTMRHCWLMREECQSEVTLLNLAASPLALMCLCFQFKTQHKLSLVHLTRTVMMQANTAPSETAKINVTMG